MNQVNKDNLTDLVETVPQAQNAEPTKMTDNAQEQSNTQPNKEQSEPDIQGVKPVPEELAENQVLAQDGSVIDLGITPPVIK